MENILNNLDNILKEDNYLQIIYTPTLNQPLDKKSTIGDYIFINGETFHGTIKDKIMQKGKYTWPNGQEFYGNLSPNNTFNKKGKIIFPNKDELNGNFNPERNTIEKAIYKTSTRIYQGTFKNNRFHGKFIIKNNEKSPKYLFVGNYLNGIKNGKFSLETIYDNQIIKITGAFNNGKKDGDFKIILLKENDEKEVAELTYKNDFLIPRYDDGEKIENKQYFEYNEKNKICCMTTMKENNELYLLLGSYEILLIYYINKKEIYLNKSICLFKKEDINDILQLKDGKILLCSSNNNFKLIELLLKQKGEKNPFKIDYKYIKILKDYIIVKIFFH